MFDVRFARSLFPAFEREPSDAWGFFENAGGSYLPAAVLDRYTEFLTDFRVQPYGNNPMARRAGDAMDAGRLTLATMLGVPLDRLTIGPSTTQNLNTLSHAFADTIGPGDEVVVTDQDHEANIGCWVRLCEQTGASLRWWHVDPLTGLLDLTDLDGVITDATAIVAMTHVSNLAGVVNPVESIADRVHAIGAFFVVDGVSAAPHIWPDVETTGADAYTFSLYKTYGPHLGAMVCSERLLNTVTAQSHFFNTGTPWKRLDAAGPNHAAIGALVGLGEFFDTLAAHHGIDDKTRSVRTRAVSALMREHENTIAQPLVELLLATGTRVVGTADHPAKVANFALAPNKVGASEIVTTLETARIATKADHFYAARLAEAMGIAGAARISFAHYNTANEVARIVDALTAVL
ncbi:MAG: aminotransferase class V-fold PLP-dependent enzyme [Actinobacteria bacterium]|nr:aminotransferase class V-fold PLP-dependent enzyme [Actinomycetota bacterium]